MENNGKTYFYIHFAQDERLLTKPVAYASSEWTSELQQMGPDFHFAVDARRLNDYLTNHANLPLMSERMKTLLAGVSGAEKASWYQVDVIDREGRAWPYHIPVFRQAAKVLNKRKSEMVDGVLVEPVFEARKINGLDFFPVGPGAEIRLVVSGSVKDRLEAVNITGVEFVPVKVA
ncbi:MAG: hypothetical protein GX776_09815 [Oxalobacter sp.]|nr:hypothetical protein [Oxalobacter sp.]